MSELQSFKKLSMPVYPACLACSLSAEMAANKVASQGGHVTSCEHSPLRTNWKVIAVACTEM